VEGALHSLGFEAVRDVHVGRHIVIETEASDRGAAERSVHSMCEKLLANPVTEDFEIEPAAEA
jgi:phosphoribosylformylglycinamidine synthase